MGDANIIICSMPYDIIMRILILCWMNKYFFFLFTMQPKLFMYVFFLFWNLDKIKIDTTHYNNIFTKITFILTISEFHTHTQLLQITYYYIF